MGYKQTKGYREAIFSWYNNTTHKVLSVVDQLALTNKELEKDFYYTINMEATIDSVRYLKI
jgi:hypothetical protein